MIINQPSSRGLFAPEIVEFNPNEGSCRFYLFKMCWIVLNRCSHRIQTELEFRQNLVVGNKLSALKLLILTQIKVVGATTRLLFTDC